MAGGVGEEEGLVLPVGTRAPASFLPVLRSHTGGQASLFCVARVRDWSCQGETKKFVEKLQRTLGFPQRAKMKMKRR